MSAAGGTISVLVGTVLLRLTLTGAHTRYVRAGMAPWLVVAGVVVIALGVVTLVRALRRPPGSPVGTGGGAGGTGRDDDHDHGRGLVGWMLLAPIAALLLVAPPSLGSYGVDRGATVDVRAGAPTFEPLDPAAGPVPMTLLEFNQRAVDGRGETFAGTTVRLTGFVADDGEVFRIARYQIACCAVDAAPVTVRVVGAHGEPPERDRWVTVTGTFRPAGDSGEDGEDGEGGAENGGGGDPAPVPELAATSVVEVAEPGDPYE